MRPGFIEHHDLWTADQKAVSEQIQAIVKERDLLLIRTAWSGHALFQSRHFAAIAHLKQSELFPKKMGEQFINYIIKIKENEIQRFLTSVADKAPEEYLKQVTDWEHREYFKLF